jgi:hypothetical protein
MIWPSRQTVRCSPVRDDSLVMRKRTQCAPAERATQYLERIARLTGATQDADGIYHLNVGRRRFLVDYKFVRVVALRGGEATCFSVVTYPDIPSAEVIASALLQLKNNPRLFDKWRNEQGDAFKANGQMFGNTFWATLDEIER